MSPHWKQKIVGGEIVSISMISCGCVANRGGADGSWLRGKWDVGVHLNTGQLSHDIHHSNGEGFSGREYAGPYGARHLSML